jgi:hypothetical protein
MQTNQGNEEFTKWWSRWRSRLQHIAAKTNQPRSARKAKLDRIPASTEASRRILGEAEFKRYLRTPDTL